jgi:hypothetical protein
MYNVQCTIVGTLRDILKTEPKATHNCALTLVN